MEIKRIGSQPSGKGPADWFTGTVRIEYDATRLNEPTIKGLVARTGINVIETVSTLPPQPTPEEIAAAQAAAAAAAAAKAAPPPAK